MSEFMSEETVAGDDEIETPSEPESSVDSFLRDRRGRLGGLRS